MLWFAVMHRVEILTYSRVIITDPQIYYLFQPSTKILLLSMVDKYLEPVTVPAAPKK